METSDQNSVAPPLMNNAIPGILPRESFLKRFSKVSFSRYCLLFIAAGAIPFAVIDYNYKEQAQEINLIYTTKVKHHSDDIALRLTVNEELRVLQMQGYTPKSWAVDFNKFMRAADYYVTPDGLERKR
ncbi:MAG: hypothetical protein AABX07_00430 [Nanoarchaeota archaeon]